jgi:hypothetical protein
MAGQWSRENAVEEIIRAMVSHHVRGSDGIEMVLAENFELIEDDDLKALEAVARIAIAQDPARYLEFGTRRTTT